MQWSSDRANASLGEQAKHESTDKDTNSSSKSRPEIIGGREVPILVAEMAEPVEEDEPENEHLRTSILGPPFMIGGAWDSRSVRACRFALRHASARHPRLTARPAVTRRPPHSLVIAVQGPRKAKAAGAT